MTIGRNFLFGTRTPAQRTRMDATDELKHLANVTVDCPGVDEDQGTQHS
jgi:hypothetical protein